MTRVRFLKPFIFSDIVDVGGTDYLFTINANSQMEGYISDDLFAVLDGEGLVVDLDA
jgi:beta-mannanase